MAILGKAGSCIKRWEMKKGKIQLHERFQQEMAAHLLSCLPNYSVYVSLCHNKSHSQLKGLRHEDFAKLGQFCAKIII